MTKNQYENIVETTIMNESADNSNLDTVRAILKNLGIGFPKGDVKEIRAALETEDFMGWKKCDSGDAAKATFCDTPVITVSPEKVYFSIGNEYGAPSDTNELDNRSALTFFCSRNGTCCESKDYPAASHFIRPMYIRNSISGKYLASVNGSLTLVPSSDTLSDESAKWQFAYQPNSDICSITPISDKSRALCVDESGSINLEIIINSADKANGWEILKPELQEDEYLIRSSETAEYLTESPSGILVMSAYPGTSSKWSVSDICSASGLKLPVYSNLNQKYHLNDVNMIRWGCCVCACCDAASIYHGSAYTLADMAEHGVYTPCDPTDMTGESGDVRCFYMNVPSANFLEMTVYNVFSEDQTRHMIRDEILAGRPVVVRIGTVYGHEHYVVAYGFENDAASNSDILVLDPCNLHPCFVHPDYNVSASNDPNGQDITLAASMAEQGGYYGNITYQIISLVKTSPKA